MTTRTAGTSAPPGYDPAQYPAFAVTVDVVVLTLADGELQVLLVRRGGAPYQGAWAIPGGFKLPTETLDEAARRELAEETGVDAERDRARPACLPSSAPMAIPGATRA